MPKSLLLPLFDECERKTGSGMVEREERWKKKKNTLFKKNISSPKV